MDKWATHTVRHIHMIGVGGIGMSGIAEVLANLGYRVSGSDLKQSIVIDRLKERGVKVHLGHVGSNIGACDLVVVSSAIPKDNVELVAARRGGVPVLSRAEMLAELMRLQQGVAVAGTHGKTTTTSLLASLMADAGLDPTYVIGGRLNSTCSGAKLGEGRYLVVEADESDGSFLHLQPTMAVLTNVDRDHLDEFSGDFGKLQQCYIDFVHRLPFYGLLIWCQDDPVLVKMQPSFARPFLSYGVSASAYYRAKLIATGAGGGSRFTVSVGGEQDLCELYVGMPGHHNMLNALAAFAVCHQLEVPVEKIKASLASFSGVTRRCQRLGRLGLPGGGQALLIDDYGHHPNEIRVTVEAVRSGWPGRRVVVVFQPHRYSRTESLFDDFVDVLSELELVILLDVYSAGETPRSAGESSRLCRALRARGQHEPIHAKGVDKVPQLLSGVLRDKDIVLVMGAGDIGSLGPQLLHAFPRSAGAAAKVRSDGR